jgi:hypothetical protein
MFPPPKAGACAEKRGYVKQKEWGTPTLSTASSFNCNSGIITLTVSDDKPYFNILRSFFIIICT